jgi:hypothetical protein
MCEGRRRVAGGREEQLSDGGGARVRTRTRVVPKRPSLKGDFFMLLLFLPATATSSRDGAFLLASCNNAAVPFPLCPMLDCCETLCAPLVFFSNSVSPFPPSSFSRLLVVNPLCLFRFCRGSVGVQVKDYRLVRLLPASFAFGEPALSSPPRNSCNSPRLAQTDQQTDSE